MAVPISNVVRRVVFAPSGTGPYAFTFEILAATDIEVYKGDTLLTLTTDYTVTINVNGTGEVTLVATAGTDNITIIGARTIQRTTDFVTGGDFFANSLNEELDSLTIFAQQNSEAVDRALRAPETDPTTINMTLPRAADRAGKYLAFDSNGNPEPGDTSQEVAIVAANISSINTVKGQITPVNNIATVAGAATNIATVAGIAANVSTVAGISSNVTTVAGISADVTAVAGDATDIGLVAAVSSDVAALGPIAADITALAAIDSDITTLAAVDSDIAALGPAAADITTVAGISADVTAVAGDATDIGTVAGLSTEIAALGPIAADITTVAGIDSDVTAVAADATDIGAVAGSIANVNTVAGIAANVTTVAGISADVTAVAGDATDIGTVAGIAANVTTVAGIAANVTTVAGISSDVTTVAGDSADIQLLAANIGTIASKANAGANSDITSLSGLTTPLSVPQGGTGASTLTAENVILGDGTNPVKFVAPGSSGNVLTSNGTTWTSAAPTGGTSDKIEEGNSSVEVVDAGTGKIEFTVDAVEVADFTAAEVVFNETGANQDFRVEGDTKANLFFVDASADAVGIGTNSPDYLLEIENTASSQDADLSIKSATNGTSNIFFGDSDAANRGRIAYSNNTDSLELFSAATKAAEFDSNQVFKFNSGYGSVATAYGCRAWVNFNGTGTVAIRGSGNVSSITDNGTGDYTVNLTSSMPDTNYAVTGECIRVSIETDINTSIIINSVSAWRIYVGNEVNTRADVDYCYSTAFR